MVGYPFLFTYVIEITILYERTTNANIEYFSNIIIFEVINMEEVYIPTILSQGDYFSLPLAFPP